MKQQVTIPIVYGSRAQLATDLKDPSHTHKWQIYLNSSLDLSNILQVEFHLHESFLNPIRLISNPPFIIHDSGWGEFQVKLKLSLLNEKPIILLHHLQLYPKPSDEFNTPDSVVSEVYDEIIVNVDVNSPLYTALTSAKQIPLDSMYNSDYEEKEVQLIEQAIQSVDDEIDKLNLVLKTKNQEIEAIRISNIIDD